VRPNLRSPSEDSKLAEWQRIIRRIADEHFRQGWNHYMFRLVRAVFRANPKLSSEGGFIMSWLAENYVDSALMLLRRELDKQHGTDNLRNLLFDIADHPSILTRARYRAMWPSSSCNLADKGFTKFPLIRPSENPDEDHIDPNGVREDLNTLLDAAEALRTYAECTRAHRTPEQAIDTTKLTFRNLHATIRDVRNVVNRYHVLLTASSIVEWEPIAQFNTIAPFMQPWVTDLDSVRAFLDEVEP